MFESNCDQIWLAFSAEWINFDKRSSAYFAHLCQRVMGVLKCKVFKGERGVGE